MTTPDADLEIRLSHRYAGGYSVVLRFTRPDSEALDDVESDVLVQFDLAALRNAEGDPVRYGQMLSDSLFADRMVGEKFVEASAIADRLDVPLRVRLFVTRGAPDLHALRWETLRHPSDGAPLASSDRVLFSRYLSNADWRSVRRQPKSELQALVAIANPTKDIGPGPGQWPLAPIDVAGEQERARTALGSEIPVIMASPPVTIDTLTAHVRAHGPDILYLVCHGGRRNGEPIVYLEGEGGAVAVVTAAELVEQLHILEQRLRLVILASCRGAGGEVIAGAGGALAALGPLLAEAGVPAVVAMQGDVAMRTVEQFMPVFFAELREHGQIDRAMARARNAVRAHPDSWMPVLFLRLKNGKIWYEPGFGDDDTEFKRWPSLLRAIDTRRCIPILGSGVTNAVFGTRREIAQAWAKEFHFPLAPHYRDSLPQVAQFLTVEQDPTYPLGALEDLIRKKLLAQLDADRRPALAKAALSAIAADVGREKRTDEAEPHRVLASLELPIYITTNPDNLLADALRDAGKEPNVELFRWFNETGSEWPPSVYEQTPSYQPSPEQPLVYHLMGHLDYPDTPVLTEDHYFNYLIGATRNRGLIPGKILGSLATHALLFVGFQMDDWDFRVLFWSIISGEAAVVRSRPFHVGVQVAPDEDRFPEAEAARKHLAARYFDLERISLYWGTPEDFARDLLQERKTASAERDRQP